MPAEILLVAPQLPQLPQLRVEGMLAIRSDNLCQILRLTILPTYPPQLPQLPHFINPFILINYIPNTTSTTSTLL